MVYWAAQNHPFPKEARMTAKPSSVLDKAQFEAAKVKATRLDDIEPDDAEPVWKIATLFPAQGAWSEEDYLELETNHLIEYSHGYIEVLPMPTELHQDIVLMLYELLKQYVKPRALGKILLA